MTDKDKAKIYVDFMLTTHFRAMESYFFNPFEDRLKTEAEINARIELIAKRMRDDIIGDYDDPRLELAMMAKALEGWKEEERRAKIALGRPT